MLFSRGVKPHVDTMSDWYSSTNVHTGKYFIMIYTKRYPDQQVTSTYANASTESALPPEECARHKQKNTSQKSNDTKKLNLFPCDFIVMNLSTILAAGSHYSKRRVTWLIQRCCLWQLLPGQGNDSDHDEMWKQANAWLWAPSEITPPPLLEGKWPSPSTITKIKKRETYCRKIFALLASSL